MRALDEVHVKPNLLLILAEQLRWDALACNGNPVMETRNIDRLATTGINCSASYTPDPFSVPARAADRRLLSAPLHRRTEQWRRDQAQLSAAAGRAGRERVSRLPLWQTALPSIPPSSAVGSALQASAIRAVGRRRFSICTSTPGSRSRNPSRSKA